jgi:hypothetical protein
MYTKLLAVALLIGTSHAKAQGDSIRAEILVTNFSVADKVVKLDSPILIFLGKTGCSDIVILGKFDGEEIGIQFELITSYIGNTPSIIKGYAFFHRKDGNWKISSLTQYQKVDLIKRSPGKLLMGPEDFSISSFGLGALSGEYAYRMSYKDRYYLLR